MFLSLSGYRAPKGHVGSIWGTCQESCMDSSQVQDVAWRTPANLSGQRFSKPQILARVMDGMV